jgi:hypothetical protein
MLNVSAEGGIFQPRSGRGWLAHQLYTDFCHRVTNNGEQPESGNGSSCMQHSFIQKNIKIDFTQG